MDHMVVWAGRSCIWQPYGVAAQKGPTPFMNIIDQLEQLAKATSWQIQDRHLRSCCKISSFTPDCTRYVWHSLLAHAGHDSVKGILKPPMEHLNASAGEPRPKAYQNAMLIAGQPRLENSCMLVACCNGTAIADYNQGTYTCN